MTASTPLRLFILRHGQAEPYTADDDGRQLVEAGRAEVLSVIDFCLPELQSLAAIWVSPLVRARQTAGLVEDRLGPRAARSESLLTPEADPRALLAALQEHVWATPQPGPLLLVSHQPLVGRLLDLLTGDARGTHAMATGALACFDLEFPAAGLGQLRWLRHASSL